MFFDEGFGLFGEESLQQSIKVLAGLTGMQSHRYHFA